MNHQKTALRAIILEILAGREQTSLEPYCLQHLFTGVAEVLERREPSPPNPTSIEPPRATLSDADTLLAQEIFWDLIIERVITPGHDHANQSLPFFRVHSEATRLHAE
ncbi:MAG: hypothetical protein JSR82_03145 [Verrucomicrobia bacterium]|nr:hypothetical protein [Verrucomicrobiota bacterium]